jgi:hypothetical protein
MKHHLIDMQNLSDEEQKLSEQISEVVQRIEECHKRMENDEGQKALIEKYTHFEKLDRSIVDEFIDLVEIGITNDSGEREIHIHWKI